MIRQLRKFQVYHVRGTLVPDHCLIIMYLGYRPSPDLNQNLKAGWQFLCMADLPRTAYVTGTAIVHPRAGTLKRMLDSLVLAKDCPHHEKE